MICKWCGNSMETRETVCRRCGKEVPAKSDCGGFYDLVPDAQGIVPPVTILESIHSKRRSDTLTPNPLPVYPSSTSCALPFLARYGSAS